ncbi:hypothetical protein NCCP1664_02320 [Zafaria cholistanensis]|uniref:Uncharacterized protein n=1 Tax=Zafaria cholistanensis TaxID=1682741 RepID=A0A5A7NLF8_9MICC|nr:hypothetical protein NCCP1664_02320 [Zafaria cholistanensis]
MRMGPQDGVPEDGAGDSAAASTTGSAAGSAAASAADGTGDGGGEGLLARFPEAVDAHAAAEAAGPVPVGAAGRAFRVLLYGGMAVGAVSALALAASFVLHLVLVGTSVRAGYAYFAAGPEGEAVRELLGVPLGGFVAAVVVSLAAICVGAFGVLRERRRAAM